MSRAKRDWTKISAWSYAGLVCVVSLVCQWWAVVFSGWYITVFMVPMLLLWWLDGRQAIDAHMEVSDLRRRVRALERRMGDENKPAVIDTNAEPTGAIVLAKEDS